ncbi:unnamed protein product (macronuclear) [Paramecium tetraurelia]|uniref:Uncharacterized protein n=1 Tax=Paramecium tetraurelia TaxID=5888 RepID=A0DQ54_PARTE|nr:uncharacterized protein GSPATT00002571001 [Paramecium tetraurelia]CAK85171.1 unnamed protein product [Paramecium tetraurelia]|eukprot:XP_001452568.1 hypothetical protein (macronuclear) [Paramecium tetraurelia strain d4-2]
MQNERLQQLLRSKGSSYIPQNTQAVSPLNKQSQNSINQSNKYITNYAVQKIQNQSTHIAITSSSDRRTTPTPSRSSMNVMPQHSSSVSPIRLVQLSTERVQKPQEIHEVHHFERPIQVVNAEDMEYKYKFKIQQLEYMVYQLQVENQRIKINGYIEQPAPVESPSKVNELEKINKNLRILEDKQRTDIKQLKEELQQWKDRYGELQKQQSNQIGFNEELRQLKKSILQFEDENKDLQMHLRDKDQEILKLRSILNEKDDIIDQLNDQIQELQVFQENYSRVETTLVSLQGEVDVWRKKFKEKNEEASELSEKLIMAETSLEAMKKRQTTQVKEVNISKSNNHNIGITMTQSIDMPGSTHNSNKQQS